MEIDIGVHALLVTKLKIFSLLFVKQQLSSGLLKGHGKKSSFTAFSETDLRKNWLISLKFSGLTSPKKTIGKKMADFMGIILANFARNKSILHQSDECV